MAPLVWDQVGSRTFENGLDRGVLYLPDGSAVPWNGLTAVIEKFDKKTNPIYFDGMKVNDLPELGDFSATMKAVTYPDEFVDLEGVAPLRQGVYAGDQKPKTFGLCYRTLIGDDLEGPDAGYRINILYNVTAIPMERTYASISQDPTLIEFEWALTAVPQEIEGMRPTAHIMIDSRDVDPWLLEDLEAILYGNGFDDATLLPMDDLIAFLNDWLRVSVIDNGDGTWTATSVRDGFIFISLTGSFRIEDVNAIYLSDVIWQMQDTRDITDILRIKITYNGDETWTATATSDALIVETGPGEVDILDANIEIVDEDTYTISDTIG